MDVSYVDIIGKYGSGITNLHVRSKQQEQVDAGNFIFKLVMALG